MEQEQKYEMSEQEKKDMKEYWDEEEKRQIKEKELLDKIQKEISKRLYDWLMLELDEGSNSYFEIVKEPVGENQDREGYEFWINQTVNGGYTGDDFQGYAYFKLSKNRYLKWFYDLG